MKIFINKPNESWIVDRFVEEFKLYNKELIVENIKDSDLIWIISPWTWKKVPKKYLKNKSVICTIHHIDEQKFSSKEGIEFHKLDKYVDYYHAISFKTYEQISKLTKKKIYTIPFWINQNLWFHNPNRNVLRKKYNISEDNFCIGSFQRDTEGKGKNIPKLSKGPDRFLEIVKFYSRSKNLAVVLTGYRREFLIEELKKLDIKYYYFEQVSNFEVNELYNCLDLYIVASRVEGGPQAILECAITKTPIISTDVGIAREILPSVSLFNMDNFKDAIPDPKTAFKNIETLKIPSGFKSYIRMFKEVS